MANWHSIKDTADYYRLLRSRGAHCNGDAFAEFCGRNDLVKLAYESTDVVSYESVLRFGRITCLGRNCKEMNHRDAWITHFF